MIFCAAVRLQGHLRKEGEQGFKPAKPPSGVHSAAAVTSSTSRAGEKVGDLSDSGVDQVATEVLDEFGTFKLESILESMVKIANNYLKLSFQLFPVKPAAGRNILVHRLPGDLDIELLNPNSSFVPNFAELLLIKEVGMVEQTGIAFHFGAIPRVGFQLQYFLSKVLVVFQDGGSLERELRQCGFRAFDFPSQDVDFRILLRIILWKLDHEIRFDCRGELGILLSSGFILQFDQMGNIGRVIRNDLNFPLTISSGDGNSEIFPWESCSS